MIFDLTYALRFHFLHFAIASVVSVLTFRLIWNIIVDHYYNLRNASIKDTRYRFQLKFLHIEDALFFSCLMCVALQLVVVPMGMLSLKHQIGQRQHEVVSYEFDQIVYEEENTFEFSIIKDGNVILMLDEDLKTSVEEKLHRQISLKSGEDYSDRDQFDIKLKGRISTKIRKLSDDQLNMINNKKSKKLVSIFW